MSNKAITLDPRIPKGLASVISPMDVFSKYKADRFMSMVELVGYAADRLDDFSNLEGLTANLVRCVSVNPGALYPFECSLVMNPCGLVKHQFFIPKSAVYCSHDDISKARPFTIAEFEDLFDIGDKLCLRVDRSPRCLVGQVLAYRCIAGDDESLEVLISGLSICLKPIQWLFEHVEYSLLSGGPLNWRPFGTEGV